MVFCSTRFFSGLVSFNLLVSGQAASFAVPPAGDDASREADGVGGRLHVLGGLDAPPLPPPPTLRG